MVKEYNSEIVVWILWERDNTPYEASTNLLDIYMNKVKADEECRKLNDQANRKYQEELKYFKERWGNRKYPTRGNIPKMSYHVNQWTVVE